MVCECFDKSMPEAFSTSRISTSNKLPINSDVRPKSLVILLKLATQLPQPGLHQKGNQVGHFNLLFIRIAKRSDLSSLHNWFASLIFNIDQSSRTMTNCTDYFTIFPEFFGEGNGGWISGQIDDRTMSADVEDGRII